MADYHRDRRSKINSGEHKPRITKKQRDYANERIATEALSRARDGAYPNFLAKAGRKLWDEIQAEFELSAVSEPIAVEICRIKDRLDRCAAALSSNHTLWFELGEPEELASGDVQMQVVVNNMLSESRQLANTLSQLMKKLELLAPARQKSSEQDPMAALAAEMERVANGG